MARDKEHELRMQGAIWAGNLIKKEGMEAYDREMRMRNMLRLPITQNGSEIKKIWDTISGNIFNNILTVALYVLYDTYGFKKTRLERFMKAFQKIAQDSLDLDYMGEHYVRLEDFAIELKERFGVEIDVEMVAAAQNDYDQRSKEYHMLQVESVIIELEQHGMKDAAEYLRRKIA